MTTRDVELEARLLRSLLQLKLVQETEIITWAGEAIAAPGEVPGWLLEVAQFQARRFEPTILDCVDLFPHTEEAELRWGGTLCAICARMEDFYTHAGGMQGRAYLLGGVFIAEGYGEVNDDRPFAMFVRIHSMIEDIIDERPPRYPGDPEQMYCDALYRYRGFKIPACICELPRLKHYRLGE
ncbi:MAG: hypothetical protein IT436_04465 [Phycisphaerales bacterium]|nr:hypothetical protein [Phycisphaerales bacterium]